MVRVYKAHIESMILISYANENFSDYTFPKQRFELALFNMHVV